MTGRAPYQQIELAVPGQRREVFLAQENLKIPFGRTIKVTVALDGVRQVPSPGHNPAFVIVRGLREPAGAGRHADAPRGGPAGYWTAQQRGNFQVCFSAFFFSHVEGAAHLVP